MPKLDTFCNNSHLCKYVDFKLVHDETWISGKWYEWLDKDGNTDVARMKDDAIDHVYPPTKVIKEENVVAFREI